MMLCARDEGRLPAFLVVEMLMEGVARSYRQFFGFFLLFSAELI